VRNQEGIITPGEKTTTPLTAVVAKESSLGENHSKKGQTPNGGGEKASENLL